MYFWCMILRLTSIILLLLVIGPTVTSQSIDSSKNFFSILAPADHFDQKRFNIAATTSGIAYTAFSIGFYNSWYKDFPKSKFHLFNDLHEWEYMDKGGHVFSGYFQSYLTYTGAKWTGLSERKSIWTGILYGSLFQTTIEVMDGFSEQWGFSIPDITANTIGIGAFALQQNYWREQRIYLKESAWPTKHPNDVLISSGTGSNPISLRQRADQLYGTSIGEKLLKDYNAQTYWASINVESFLPDQNKWPDWLNIAVGYGAENMYGGFENKWTSNGIEYNASGIERYHQFYLSLDADLTKIKSKNAFLRTILPIFNIFKMPAPAIEITSRGDIIFHFIHF